MKDLEIIKLINLVKEHKPLYDQNDKRYASKKLLHKIWADIAEQMNVDEQECRRKWICLRNSYARYLREIRASDVYGKRRKEWYLSDAMSFLKDFIGLHPITTVNASDMNIDDESQSSPSESSTSSVRNSPVPCKRSRTPTIEMEEPLEEELMMPCMKFEYLDEELLNVEYEQQQQDQPKTRKGRPPKKTSLKEKESKVKTKYTNSKRSTSREGVQPNESKKEESPENGSTLFFKSLLIDYENLSRRSQRKFRMCMLEKMNELQEEEEEEQD